MAHETRTVAHSGNVVGQANTYSYSGSFDVFKGLEVKVTLDNVVLTHTSSTINESANPREYTVDTTAKTIHIGGADLSSGTIKIIPTTDLGQLPGSTAPEAKATYTPGSSITSDDLNNNQLQLMRRALEYDEQKLDTAGGTLTGDLTLGLATKIIFEGATDDAHETTLTVTDPTADRTITLPNVTGTVVTTGDTATVTATMMAANSVDSSELVDGSVDASHLASDSVQEAKIANGAVTRDKIAADAINNTKLADGAVQSENIVNGNVTHDKIGTNAVQADNILADSVTTAKIANGNVTLAKIEDVTDGRIIVGNGSNKPTAVAVSGDVTLANDGTVTIANDAIDSEHYADASIDNRHLANDAVTTDKILAGTIINDDISGSASIDHSKIAAITDGHIIVGSGSNVPTAVAVSGDVTIANTGAVTIANDAVEIGMIGCEQTTISDSDSHIPTSGAVVDYVAAQIAPIGGLEVIADDESFPNTIPAAGVVISITDAAGLQVNSSGVSTNGDALDNSTITINGFPSELRGGVGGNADPYVFQSGAGLMVQSTGSSHTYNYHQALIRESDFVQLSDDINDFNSRYRVAADASGVRTGQCSTDGSGSGSFPCDGDMAWFKNSSKMYVFDPISDFNAASNSDKDACWKEVSSVGDYKFLTIKDHDQAVGGSGPTYNGSNVEFDLFDGSADASITNAAQLIVVLNGVVQKPNASYSGSMEGFSLNDTHGIKFATAPPSDSTMFVTQIGTATTIGTPGTGSISAANMFAAGVINAAAIGTGAVEHAKLANDAVDGDNLADNACNSEHYTDGSIDHVHLAADIIDGDNIQDDVINSEHIAAGAVDLEHMSSQSVDEDNLYIDNAGSNGQFLSKQSGGTGGLLWATVSTQDTLSHRNLIINGAMQVAQRGTSDTTDAQNFTTVDRWRIAWNGLEEQPSKYQEQLSSSDSGPWELGFRNAWKLINGNQTGGADADGYIHPQYAVEAQDIASSGWDYTSASSKITLSFWVKSSVAQTFYGYLRTIDGTSQAYSFSYAVLANTWTKVTKTIPGNSNIQIDNNNGSGLYLFLPTFTGTDKTDSGNSLNTWAAYSGSNRMPDHTTTWYTTNDATWHLTGVQLETGDTATTFEHRSFGDELNRCLRYYYRVNADDQGDLGVAPGWCRDTERCHGNINFPVPMRDNPSSLETTGTAGDYAVAHKTSGPVGQSVPAFDSATKYSASLTLQVTGNPFTAGECGRIQKQTNDAYLAWESEI